jgi:hypothetical protein
VSDGLDIAFFGSSLVSSWWNGSCTYYRGIIRGLHELGHRVTFYEPIAYERQEHRDIADPDWARVVIYEAPDEAAVRAVVEQARGVDMVVKTSGVGVFDDVLEDAVLSLGTYTAFWDVDAPATLSRMEDDADDSFRALLPSYDLVLTYGGGEPVVRRYTELGARECLVVYNALDPTTHHPTDPTRGSTSTSRCWPTGCPDRRSASRSSSCGPRRCLPRPDVPAGRQRLARQARCRRTSGCSGHVGTADHNAFNSTPLAVSNVHPRQHGRQRLVPATRVFEVAWRRGVPDHRRLAGHRGLPRARPRGAGRLRRPGGRRPPARARPRARPPSSARRRSSGCCRSTPTATARCRSTRSCGDRLR